MSLLRLLRNDKNPIGRYFRTRFPNTRTLLKDCRKQFRLMDTLMPDDELTNGALAVIGTALDYRIRYYFRVVPSTKLVAFSGHKFLSKSGRDASHARGIREEFFSRLYSLLEHLNPVGRRLTFSEENELNRYCIVLAHLESLVRSPFVDSPLYYENYNCVDELLELAQPPWIDDMERLSVRFYENYNHLLSLSHVLNPSFAGTPDVYGADADLIVDGTLIDIKTTKKQTLAGKSIFQLLGYTLLDYLDEFSINGIGLYMARQGHLFHWELGDALEVLQNGEPLTIRQLRIEFERLVKTYREEVEERNSIEGILRRYSQKHTMNEMSNLHDSGEKRKRKCG